MRYHFRVYAPLAQLDRVFGYEPKGRGFESLTACQKKAHLRCRCAFFSYIRLAASYMHSVRDIAFGGYMRFARW